MTIIMLRNIQDWQISVNGFQSESKLELADRKNMTIKLVLADFNFFCFLDIIKSFFSLYQILF